jgi:hypothetical protein
MIDWLKSKRIGYVEGFVAAYEEMLEYLPNPVQLREIADILRKIGEDIHADICEVWADRADEAAEAK